MSTVKINFNNIVGKIKNMHAVNNGPIVAGSDQTKGNHLYYKAAGIPYARNHDASFHASYGGEHSVDIHAIFPNFDADVNDPASYDFPCTDHYTKQTGQYIWNTTRYGGTCTHECSINSGCRIQKCNVEENHTHSDAKECYTYTWTLQWKQYTITWNIGEGAWADNSTDASKTTPVEHNDVLKAPAVKESFKVTDPEKGEITYTFQGWEGLADGTTATGNATYTAKYTTETVYIATLNLDGGQGATELRIEKGETFAAPVNPTKTDYMFVK